MRVSIRQYAQVLLALSEGRDAVQAKDVARQFSEWLTRKGGAKKLPSIVREADRLRSEREGRVEVSIVTAHGVDADTKDILTQQAQHIFPGKKVTARYSTNERLVGGVVFRSDEVLYDVSLATAIRQLRATLIE